ncbi:MAG: U32 family peptidase [Muribaculaceae bacterium]|nr:U32 family peptidase [Muribaculaceae bacterium]MBO5187523.1 U32 family peptidase [Prevotella sp.]
MQRSDFEIMAPVGSFESLHAAINAGADSIYFGVGHLNMRARSSLNFTLDDLKTIAHTCNRAGVKSYLTLNTVMFDEDLEPSRQALLAAREAGVSAIIAADIAVIEMARQLGVEVHISTQANITNFQALKFYSRWANVVVLAREMTMEKVAAIHDLIKAQDLRGPAGELIKIEMFCHGALCMATSGKCYLSLHEMNSSANRGSCTQICRRAYDLTDRETGEQITVDGPYLMSPKDLKTIHFLNKMVDAGVRVFKIEGRARGPEYVSEAVACYSKALDAICDNTFDDKLIASLDNRLDKIFNRGFWNGYYLGQRLGEWSSHYGSSATRVKDYCAKGVKYFSRSGVGEFLMEAGELCVGDEIVITGPTTGALILTVQDIRVDLKSVPKAVKGDSFSIAVPAKIRPSDRLYRWRPVDQAPRHKRF